MGAVVNMKCTEPGCLAHIQQKSLRLCRKLWAQNWIKPLHPAFGGLMAFSFIRFDEQVRHTPE
jgi:hypothetical protein